MTKIDEISAFVQEIKSDLREKWLDYYENNHLWIVSLNIHKSVGWDQTIEGVKRSSCRPSDDFIVAVISALEPQIAKVIPYCLTVNPNKSKLVSLLGLDFDPEKALAEREFERFKTQQSQTRQARVVHLLPEGGAEKDEERNREFEADVDAASLDKTGE